jgi:hypothetical protein
MSSISERPFGQYDILLKNGSDHLFPGSVELGCRDYDARVLFYFTDEGNAVFVDIGSHDEVY